MPRLLGPHRPGDPAHETLMSASARLLTEVDGAVERGALELMVDDAVAPEVMTGERVDTLMLASHVFGVDERVRPHTATPTGHPGLIAFTERRLIAAHSYGIIRFRRFVEVFALDGQVAFRAETPMIAGRPARMFEIENGQGWHRIFLPDGGGLSVALLAAWDHRIAARLVGARAPRWDGNELVGWESGNATIPTRRPPEADQIGIDVPPDDGAEDLDADDDGIDPSGPLPRTDLSPAVRWWDR